MVSRYILVIVVAASVFCQSAWAQQPQRPNVVLIVADDIGYGDLSSYGAPDLKTPHLDRLARTGVRMTDFYANAPVCTPTRAALISGRYQQRVLLERPLGSDVKTGLPVTAHSLPQLVKNAGYATALVGKWHLGNRPEFGPNRHGFDYFWGYLTGYIDWYTHNAGNGKPDLWENGNPVTHSGYFGHEVTRRAIEFIATNSSRPFFLEVALGQPHWPYQSPHRASVARDNASHVRASEEEPPRRQDYVEIVQDADAGVGQIVAELERRGLREDTLIIFIGDNGGEWLSRNAPLFHRKDSLWEGGIRVPAIFSWPRVLPKGKVSDQVGITMDVTASILAATEATVPPSARPEGQSLLSILANRVPKVERTLFWRNTLQNFTQRAVRQGDWKLLLDGAHEFLFNLRDDVGERTELGAAHPSRVRRLRTLIEKWESDVNSEATQQKPTP